LRDSGTCSVLGLRVVRQQYRKLFRTKRVLYRKVVDNLVRDFRVNPKAAYSVFAPKQHTECAVSLSDFVVHYTQLLNPSDVQSLPVVSYRSNLSASPGFLSAGQLNVPFTEDEIGKALRKLKNHKACAQDGLSAELLKYAVLTTMLPGGGSVSEQVVVPVLCVLFNRILQSGDWPAHWSEALLHSVFKKGDKSIPGNYRGIAVEPVLPKLFASLLDSRLQDWAEHHNMRARGQAGFRRKKGTADNVYILMHLIQKFRRSKQPLYCCFVDFSKAFDMVRRDMLFARLEQLGVGGAFLAVLKSMYESVFFRLVTPQGLSDCVASLLGVKQGSPLSPTLFGLFVDELQEYFDHYLPGVGVLCFFAC
jgi:Reverse transcriptase (RNA-dependent DNA polymerase)